MLCKMMGEVKVAVDRSIQQGYLMSLGDRDTPRRK